ncbi:MAG: DUF4931 domain-containing protein [Dehalococcoidia bacterium]
MSELRLNPVTGQWVIIAGERQRRPHHFPRSQRRRSLPSYLADCPFCPGNEGSTPAHNRFPADRSEEEMALLERAYQERYRALAAQPSTRYLLIFKNHGQEAGTSIQHPHSQIIAAPVVPASVQRRGQMASEHHRREGRCLHCHLAQEEIRAGSRVVYRDEHLLVFHPFAAAHPGETWIVPLEHQPSFGQVSERGLCRFASALRRTLRQLSMAFGDPHFNYAIHSAPPGEEGTPYWHWYLQLVPRLTKAAGFELGSGIYINVAPPEETAAAMRQAPA